MPDLMSLKLYHSKLEVSQIIIYIFKNQVLEKIWSLMYTLSILQQYPKTYTLAPNQKLNVIYLYFQYFITTNLEILAVPMLNEWDQPHCCLKKAWSVQCNTMLWVQATLITWDHCVTNKEGSI